MSLLWEAKRHYTEATILESTIQRQELASASLDQLISQPRIFAEPLDDCVKHLRFVLEVA